jgi:phosphotransferase system enzyme I (PtsP)
LQYNRHQERVIERLKSMVSRRGDEPRVMPSEPALRVIMRRLRDILGEADDGQIRLNKIVSQSAGVMVANV